MDLRVTLCDAPAEVLKVAGKFLESQPVHHNLILSLLHTRVAHPEAGRYWIGQDSDGIVGLVFQSPLELAALVTPMPGEAAARFADAIASSGVSLPGVQG